MKKTALLLISVGVLFNCLSFGIDSDTTAYRRLFDASSSGFSVTVLPFSVLSKIMRGNVPLCDELKRSRQSTSDTKTAVFDKILITAASRTAGCIRCDTGKVFSGLSVILPQEIFRSPPPGHGPPGALCLVFLSYLILLRRSNLPWALAVMPAVAVHRPGLARDRVFDYMSRKGVS